MAHIGSVGYRIWPHLLSFMWSANLAESTAVAVTLFRRSRSESQEYIVGAPKDQNKHKDPTKM